MDTRTEADLGGRAREFSLAVVRLASTLPAEGVSRILGEQVLRSGAAVGASMRAVRRTRSAGEYVAAIESTLQHLDETIYWFEMLAQSGHCGGPGSGPAKKLEETALDAKDLTAMLIDRAQAARTALRPAHPPDGD